MMGREIKIALAGQPNVGKSVVFHQLTGIGVMISNYPGTTVDINRGKTHFRGQRVEIVDLPGTYSLDATSIDQEVAIRVLLEERPDVVIDIVDATNLERNLYLTFQILELGIPTVVALNQVDRARRLGVDINVKLLEHRLGVPVIPTIATKGEGIGKLAEKATEVACKKKPAFEVIYDRHIEKAIKPLMGKLKRARKKPPLPERAIAVQLLVDNPVIAEKCEKETVDLAKELGQELATIHGEPTEVHIARDRYGHAGIIAKEVVTEIPVKVPFLERLGEVTARPVIGLSSVFLVIALMYFTVFVFGGFLEELVTSGYEALIIPIFVGIADQYSLSAFMRAILLEGFGVGIEAALGIVIPYILTFYIVLGIMEDIGLLARLAFVADGVMHKIGLHGRTMVPLLLGCGCNVPAVLATRILESRKARIMTAILISLAVPCSAQTAIILGLVGRYAGLGWMILLYAFLMALLVIVGRILFALLPGEEVGLTMEMPPYRIPQSKPILMKTYLRIRSFLFIALPIMLGGSILLIIFREMGLFDPVIAASAPLMNTLLGLPSLVAIPLFYGILRKEMTLEMLVVLFGTTSFSEIFTPRQMFVFSLVTALYMPCVATCAALWREFGTKRMILMTCLSLIVAFSLGGLVNHVFLTLGL